MSMHEMEALVECSVAVLAAAQPVPADARDLCYSLYEMQDQFDCGYTVLRVQEELEKLRYLYRIPPCRLPEQERAQIAALDGQDGFIGDDPQIFYDAGGGLACITAGSPLWEKLCRAGRLTGADAEPVRLIPALEMAQRIAGLACAAEEGLAAQTMGLWYALFPAFLVMESGGEDEALSPPMRALRDRLATPAALAFAAGWRLLPGPDDFDWLEESDLFERQWLEPYTRRVAGGREDAAQAAYQQIVDAVEGSRFREALELAAALPGERERTYYRALASLAFYRLRAVSPADAPAPPEEAMPLEETERAFASLVESCPEQDQICQMNRYLSLVLLGRYEQGFQALTEAFLPLVEALRQAEEDDWKRRFGEAGLAAVFYRTLYESIPGWPPEKLLLLQTRAGTIPLPQEAEETCRALAEERPEEAWACRYHGGLCRMVQGDLEGAMEELRRADGLHPGEPEIQETMEQLLKLLENGEASSQRV